MGPWRILSDDNTQLSARALQEAGRTARAVQAGKKGGRRNLRYAAQRNQGDFRGDTKAHGRSDGAEPAIDIEHRERRLGVAKRRRMVCILKRTVIRRGHRERPEVRTCDVIGDEASGTEAVIAGLRR